MCYVVLSVVCLVCCGVVFFCLMCQNNEETAKCEADSAALH